MPNVLIPKFSLQLLVENAIKHGYVGNSTLHITLTYEKESHSLQLQNDGKPIKSTKFGTGLSNLEQRLKILCKGELKISNKQHPTFTMNLGECHENIDR